MQCTDIEKLVWAARARARARLRAARISYPPELPPKNPPDTHTDEHRTKTSSRNVEAVRSVKLKKKKIFFKAYGSPVPPSVGAFLPSLPH